MVENIPNVFLPLLTCSPFCCSPPRPWEVQRPSRTVGEAGWVAATCEIEGCVLGSRPVSSTDPLPGTVSPRGYESCLCHRCCYASSCGWRKPSRPIYLAHNLSAKCLHIFVLLENAAHSSEQNLRTFCSVLNDHIVSSLNGNSCWWFTAPNYFCFCVCL